MAAMFKGNEWTIGARAVLVQGVCDQFLAGPDSPLINHGDVERASRPMAQNILRIAGAAPMISVAATVRGRHWRARLATQLLYAR